MKKTMAELEDDILVLIENRDDYTRGERQVRVGVIALQIAALAKAEIIADYARNQKGREMLEDSRFHVGDQVRCIYSRTLMGAYPAMTIEKIELDHTHIGGGKGQLPGGHRPECFTEDKIAYHVVVGAKADGSAEFRARCSSSELVLVNSHATRLERNSK